LLREVSGGRGADDIIVAVGRREIQVAAQQWLAQDGVLNLFGGLKRGEHVIELDTLRVHYDGIKLVGSSGGSPADMAQALRMVADRKFDPGQHLAMVGSLDQFPKALKMVEETKTDGKIVLYPQIQTTELIAVHNWGRAEEQEFLKKYGSSEAYG
jgi:threonine dehydrogenase-like Zn-dependent dehydrogenase